MALPNFIACGSPCSFNLSFFCFPNFLQLYFPLPLKTLILISLSLSLYVVLISLFIYFPIFSCYQSKRLFNPTPHLFPNFLPLGFKTLIFCLPNNRPHPHTHKKERTKKKFSPLFLFIAIEKYCRNRTST